jgi:WD40 repeat protein
VALTGSDGLLRIIDYRSEKLRDVFQSYFGRLTCVDWSPDGHYILVIKIKNRVAESVRY